MVTEVTTGNRDETDTVWEGAQDEPSGHWPGPMP